MPPGVYGVQDLLHLMISLYKSYTCSGDGDGKHSNIWRIEAPWTIYERIDRSGGIPHRAERNFHYFPWAKSATS